MPESIRRRGVSIAPSARMISTAARVSTSSPSTRCRTETQRRPSKPSLGRQRMRHHREIVALQYRPEIAPRRAEALSVGDIEIGRRRAFVGRAVRIVDHGNAEFSGALDQRRCNGMKRAASFDPQRTAGAAPFAHPAFPILAPFEVWQHILEGPALRAGSIPGIVVRGMAAIPHHGVDRRRAAEHLSARNSDGAAADMTRRRVVVAPVIGAAPKRNPFAGIVDFRNADAGRAGLDQQHLRAGIDQTPRHGRAAGSGADHDEIIGGLALADGESPPSLAELSDQLCSLGPMITMFSVAST